MHTIMKTCRNCSPRALSSLRRSARIWGYES